MAEKEQSFARRFFASQFTRLPYPTQSFKDAVVIVTGANTGLGLEAARHIVRLGAAKVVLAVRNQAKGEKARASIESSTKRTNVAEVWPLDLSNYQSVKDFAARVNSTLPRLDALINNAGLTTGKFELVEGMETMATVNIISTFLLTLLLFPALKRTADEHQVRPRVVIVSSESYELAKFDEGKAEKIFDALRDENMDLDDRYKVTKLLQIYLVRALADQISAKSTPPKIIINTLNPGLCRTELTREVPALVKMIEDSIKLIIARSAEQGSRTLVHAAEAGHEDTHGQYLRDCKVSGLSKRVTDEEGERIQGRIWNELTEELEKIEPGILNNI